MAKLLRDIYSYQGAFVVQHAPRLSPLIFQRPGEIRQMLWEDVHLESKEWGYLVTKTKVQHIVPLSNQVIEILEDLKQVTSRSIYVFPSSRNDGRSMSDNAIGMALRTLGYSNDDMSPHGFRTTASTLLNEQGWSPDAIERQLSHMPRDQVRAAITAPNI
jgi:integrase